MPAPATDAHDDYVLGHTQAEYERLRAQAAVWETATARLFDTIGVAPGDRCLDAGCGPGETMRLLARRVGPRGHVQGVDADGPLGAQALDMLGALGHAQCAFAEVDLERDAPVPGAPYDVVYARLLLFHVQDRVAVVRRLWDAVVPGGCLVLHDYDMAGVSDDADLESLEEWKRVVFTTFVAAGRNVRMGHQLPALLRESGPGHPDGTDVAGRLDRLADAAPMLAAVYRSLEPAAAALGIAGPEEHARWHERFAADAARHPDATLSWPLLCAAWRRKPHAPGAA